MTALIKDLQILFERELNSFIQELELFPNEETVWRTLPGITNSAGNLALHVCGNLQHFIGSVLGNTGYVRKREAEFNTKEGNRTDLIKEINQTQQIVKEVLQKLTHEELNTKYPEAVGGNEIPTGRFLIHLSVHLGMHLGQAGYLRRTITGNAKSTNPLPLNSIKY